jgi:GTPase SAR1 family protein
MSEANSVPEHTTVESHRRLLSDAVLDLRTLRDHATELKLEETAARTNEVLDRVENDFFRVAVVGEFKRGKSTLINALLGREVLPADVLPCSATLNRVTYGIQPSVTLVFKAKGDEPEHTETIGIDELADYVTKLTPESEQRAADIKEAVVHYPVKYCRDKADIIDTPGLNDDESMTDVTMSVLPQVDAAVLVILAQSPFSNYEADFLNRLLSRDLGRVLFVVNRMDSIRRPKDRQRILQAVSERIERSVKARAAELHGEGTEDYTNFLARVGKPRVYGVSGALGLDGKLDGDEGLLNESGLPQFEDALERFLTQERGLITLTVLNDTVAGAAAKLTQQIRIQEGALNMKENEFEEAYKEGTKKLEDLRTRYASELATLDSAADRLALEVGPSWPPRGGGPVDRGRGEHHREGHREGAGRADCKGNRPDHQRRREVGGSSRVREGAAADRTLPGTGSGALRRLRSNPELHALRDRDPLPEPRCRQREERTHRGRQRHRSAGRCTDRAALHPARWTLGRLP